MRRRLPQLRTIRQLRSTLLATHSAISGKRSAMGGGGGHWVVCGDKTCACIANGSVRGVVPRPSADGKHVNMRRRCATAPSDCTSLHASATGCRASRPPSHRSSSGSQSSKRRARVPLSASAHVESGSQSRVILSPAARHCARWCERRCIRWLQLHMRTTLWRLSHSGRSRCNSGEIPTRIDGTDWPHDVPIEARQEVAEAAAPERARLPIDRSLARVRSHKRTELPLL